MKEQKASVDTGQIKVKIRGTGMPYRRWETQGAMKVRESGEAAAARTSGAGKARVQPRSSPSRNGRKPGSGSAARKRGEKAPANWKSVALWQTAACMLLLAAAWGLSTSGLPWAEDATAAVKGAVTAEVDLDRSLGKLHFVRDLLPDAAFVFGDAGLLPELALPCEGIVAIGYAQEHPGLLLRGADIVTAPADGEVLGVAWQNGEGSVRIGHAGGLETIISCLGSVDVEEGREVARGDRLGMASTADGEARVYFEARVDGEVSDPSKLLANSADTP